MRLLGIVGGIAPASTVEYYNRYIDGIKRRLATGDAPHVVINSINSRHMLELFRMGDHARVIAYLGAALDVLANAGADVALFASNTPHVVFPELAARSSLPLISIVAATIDEVRARRLQRVGLLGTRFVMDASMYEQALSGIGACQVLPSRDEREFIHQRYMSELVSGVFLDETRNGILRIIDRMITEDGVQGVILGGTELPLLLGAGSYRNVTLFDTSVLHIERAIAECLDDPSHACLPDDLS